jgi:regulator of protease activity HflC (stomatin/prohibitin superfamily)
VQVWPKTTFKLNTFCDKNGGKLKPFWENLGRRYGANEEGGWRKMLLEVVVPPLEKSIRDVTRFYPADDLVGNVNGVIQEMQTKVAAQFTTELKRIAGDDYFCGPSFNRLKDECPAVELLIKDVTYNDPGIQAARNEKQKAVELAAAQLAKAQGEAAALVAEAQGKRDAAAALASLYNSPGWVQIQMQILQLEAVRACAEKATCQMMIGGNGQIFSVR